VIPVRSRRLISMSLRSLRMHWQRTVTTALAFALGFGAYAAVVTVTHSASTYVESLTRQLGVDRVLTIRAGTYRDIGGRQIAVQEFKTLRQSDANAIAAESDRLIVAPLVSSLEVARRARKKADVELLRTTTQYFEAAAFSIVAGRPWSEDDGRRNVAVIDSPLRVRLFGLEDPLGKRLLVGSNSFMITGVTAERQGRENEAGLVVVPLAFMRSINESGRIDQIVVKVSVEENIDSVKALLVRLLRREHRLRPNEPNDFSIRDEAAVIAAQNQVSDAFKLLLPAVALVSITAGAIGIMTVMSMAIRERASEIGLRRAIGATRRDILVQFFTESLLLALPASTIGEALGALAARNVAARNGWLGPIDMELLLLGFGISAALALACSVFPASRAAKLDPAIALRTE
jgi:putative ABC transport system permease protein